MTHFSGKMPPPWQTRSHASISNSILGQHPNTVLSSQQIVMGSQQTAQFGPPVQQSVIQSPGLSLQSIPQHLIPQTSLSQNSIVQTNVGTAPPPPPAVQQSNHSNPSLIIQPSLNAPHNTGRNSLPLPQLSASQIQPLQSQIPSVTYPPLRALAPGTLPSNASGALSHTLSTPDVNEGPNSNNSSITTPAQPLQKQRVFTGKITKLCCDFGFVNEDVFFQTTCIKGQVPKVGDRVLVEASYNPNMPFKWNANRIQALPNSNTNVSNTGAISRESESRITSSALLACNFSTENGSHTSNGTKIRSHKHDFKDSERTSRESKGKEGKREHNKRSADRFYSPPRRRVRLTPRYNVQVPSHSLNLKDAGAMELRKRYVNLYVPSDMFLARPLWSDAFPAQRCFQFPRAVPFHIMHKEVDSFAENDAIYDPPDISHSYAAKVMLLSVPSMEDIYRRCCAPNEEDNEDKASFVHPARLINFLVGLKGKNETIAIGGYWSPSLDGANPDTDSTVLVHTCIRTCKALTGIDLSGCSTWYRFAEIYYLRGETTHKGRIIPAHVETTVLFIPDVWNICPIKLEWNEIQSNYKQLLNDRLSNKKDKEGQQDDQHQQPQQQQATNETSTELEEHLEEEGEDKDDDSRKDPLHWTSLDPKNMKVIELRNELDARLLNSKGLKSQLVARLTKVLKSEQEKEEQDKAEEEQKESEINLSVIDKTEEEKKPKNDNDKKSNEDFKKLEEKEKHMLEKRYTLPDQPSIVVHPSRIAKSGKFDCTTLSLSVLLDYRQEDNKEHSFEVSLFAELFNEMLMRDFAFKIYQAIHEAPEKSDKKEKDRKNEKEDKEDKLETKEDPEKNNEFCLEKKNSKVDNNKLMEESRESLERHLNDQEEKNCFEEMPQEQQMKDKSEKDKSKERETLNSHKTKVREKRDKKVQTHDHLLLLSCVYFDQTHTGYILDKDLESILNLLGLNLSRSQAKKLLSKVITRDAFYYRKLTDRPNDDKKPKESLQDLEILARGNQHMLPFFSPPKKSSEYHDCQVCKGELSSGEITLTSTGMVMYDGSLIDIRKLMQNLDRSEKDRTEAEDKCKVLQKELAKTKEETKKTSEKSLRLNKEAKSALSNLKISEEELHKAHESIANYKNALENIKHIIDPLTGEMAIKEEPKDEKPVINYTINEI